MKNKKTFEYYIDELETTINKLENDSESLEESLKLFEEGIKIANACYAILNNAEQKISKLSELKIDENLMNKRGYKNEKYFN